VQNIHIYFDEDVSVLMATDLRNAGIMVHLPREIGALSARDPAHLQASTNQGWILVTHNRRDFRRLHWLWMTFYSWGIISQPHSGILTIYEAERTMTDHWPAAITQFLRNRTSLTGLMYMWRPSTNGWEREPVAFM
jgi:hypothetical protein